MSRISIKTEWRKRFQRYVCGEKRSVRATLLWKKAAWRAFITCQSYKLTHPLSEKFRSTSLDMVDASETTDDRISEKITKTEFNFGESTPGIYLSNADTNSFFRMVLMDNCPYQLIEREPNKKINRRKHIMYYLYNDLFIFSFSLL